MKANKMRLGMIVIFSMFLMLISSPAAAHYGMVIPSDSMVMQQDKRTVQLQLSFSHPFEGIGMNLVKPRVFLVDLNGKQTSLLKQLQSSKVMGHQAWSLDYAVKRPGVHAFYMEPQPYWEPTEDCYIIHYTKTVITAFGVDDDWDRELGLKTEIVPLSKPYGLYAGNVFQGVVKLDGKPVANAMVEVEYYNQTSQVAAPTEMMVTQTIKADQNGVFTYATPAAGWWGFAALNTADYKLDYQGTKKDVELGAVLWVKFQPWGNAN